MRFECCKKLFKPHLKIKEDTMNTKNSSNNPVDNMPDWYIDELLEILKEMKRDYSEGFLICDVADDSDDNDAETDKL